MSYGVSDFVGGIASRRVAALRVVIVSYPVALVVLVLLVGDPVASATSAPGRWANGILFALLAVLFGQLWAGAAPVQFCVSAALLASLAAPLFDEIALAAWLARRRHLG